MLLLMPTPGRQGTILSPPPVIRTSRHAWAMRPAPVSNHKAVDYEDPKTFTKPEQVTLPPQRRPNSQAMTPHIKMFVSDWFTDELAGTRRVPSKPVTE